MLVLLKKQMFSVAFALVLFASAVLVNAQSNQTEILSSLGLTGGSIVDVDTEGHIPGTSLSTKVKIVGQDYSVNLQPHSIRGQNFEVKVQVADGSYVQFQPPATRLLKGSIVGMTGSRIIGSVLDSGLMAKLVMPNGQTFFIEPIASRTAVDNPAAHVVYQSSDVVDTDLHCGVVDPKDRRREIVAQSIIDNNNSQVAAGTVIRVAELAIDTDVEFFNFFGTEQATLDRIELVVGITNDQYETQTNLTHALSTIIVRGSEPDPYTSFNAFTALDEFVNHWLNNQTAVQRDVAHLFTGKDLGGIGGVAFLGGLCSADAGFGLDRIDFNGMLVCSTDLLAHELGHNWDANHCNCQNNTMNGGLTCTNVFTAASVQTITSFANSLDCLEDQGGFIIGDVNQDGVVNLLDVPPFVALLSNGGFQLEADINQDGVVDLLDVNPFVDLLNG